MRLKKIKRVNYYLLSFLLIFFLCFFYFGYYSEKINNIVSNIANEYLEKDIYLIINKAINDTMNDDEINNLFILNTNDEDEILYVDYDLKKSYKTLDVITSKLKKILEKKSIIFFLPIGISAKNVFIYNLGPKIGIKVNYAESLMTNIFTKVTNYGLNNALLEVYIKVELNGTLIAPFLNDRKKINYDVLIASKVISGRVPMIYGDSIKSSSMLFDVSIK